MFIGHFAAGFAGKAVAPKASLGTLFLAAQFLDLLWPTLLLLNLEHAAISPTPGTLVPLTFTDYPISHSLLFVLGWGPLFGFIYWIFRKDKRTALVLGLLVVSHWFLDVIVHVPDLPLWPGDSPKVGLGLWRSLTDTVLLEGLFFIGGLWLYTRQLRLVGSAPSFILWALVAFLVFVHVANLFGPPPPNMQAVAWAGQLQWILVVWAYWADRKKTVLTLKPKAI